MLSYKKSTFSPFSLIIIFSAVFFICALLFYWLTFYQTHFLPQTFLNHVDIGNLTFSQAQTKLETFQINPAEKVILLAGEEKISSSSAQLSLNYNFLNSLTEIFSSQTEKSPLKKVFLALFSSKKFSFTAPVSFDQQALKNMIAAFSLRLYQPGKDGYLLLKKGGDFSSLTIEPGQNELLLDQDRAFSLVAPALGYQQVFSLPIEEVSLQYSSAQIDNLKQQASFLINKKLIFQTSQLDNFSFTLSDKDLIPLLGASSSTKLSFKQDYINFLQKKVSRPPQEPELTFINDEVSTFIPPLSGLTLDTNAFSLQLDQGLEQLSASTSAQSILLDLPLIIQEPQTSLAQTNNLGINEILGFGESYYAHSIAGRIHNVALTASRINNTLVAPGEAFSFNQTLGEVSATTGFKEGYVIKGNRSELSAGGGVCQVSTTLFRALLNAGLQIDLRLPHSYRVSYYELNNDPGFDATVYSGNVDLRFTNDTDHYLLITAQTDSDQLYMTVKIYGAADGRSATITNYKKFNAQAAPATEYITDPSLPQGTKKQIDWAIGGLQTVFTYTVYNANGSIRSQKNYPSTYQAWSAKYLVNP